MATWFEEWAGALGVRSLGHVRVTKAEQRRVILVQRGWVSPVMVVEEDVRVLMTEKPGRVDAGHCDMI